ncbi:Lysozyme [Paraburkholderia unamae]|uniref:lysozyme n=1 Tax=Paraburkholderia unamae TaxID=219649 RepID=UPI001CAE01B4|nr:lysozyme [Paraburkholderia unamae]CAG9265123.1 Lysozyme [Paraburkholderia unamae]
MTEPLHECVTNTDPNSMVNVYSQRYCKPWKFSEAGIKFLEGWEAFSATMYDKDGSAAGNATVGYGHLVHLGKISGAASEKPFKSGITEAEAEALLRKDIAWAENKINDGVKIPLFQFEYDALVCFLYNLQRHGEGIIDFVNTGDYNKVGNKIREYSNSKGKPVKGLQRRRHREAEMFEAGIYDSTH